MVKVFGCECYHFLRPYSNHKFNFHTSKYVLLSLNAAYKGYLCLYPSGKVYIARHITLNEKSFPFKNDSDFKKIQTVKHPEYLDFMSQFHTTICLLETDIDYHTTTKDETHLDTLTIAEGSLQDSEPDIIDSHFSNTITPINIVFQQTKTPKASTNLLLTYSMITRGKTGIFKPNAFINSANVKAALTDNRWYNAMREELNALIQNKT